MINTDIENILHRSEQAFREWRKTTFENRQPLFANAAKILRAKKQEFADIITSEMNKAISQSVAEVEKCAGLCDYYAEIPNVLQTEKIATENEISEIRHRPLGTVLGVMPWNYPFWQALRFAVPTILAGNCVVLKHASICSNSGKAMQQLLLDAGFPENVFIFEEISHQEVFAMLSHPTIKAVSLTGSEAAGRKIAEEAGKQLKKCVLELGGSDAFIVLADADLDLAAKDAAQARLQNCGQTCVAGKRFIIHTEIYRNFLSKFIAEYQKYLPKSPTDVNAQLTGMAREDLADDLQLQFENAIKHGAEVVLPLKRTSKIAFEPGLIRMNEGNPMLREEFFGPLGMIFEAKDDEDALHIANDSLFGLANAVYTKSAEKANYFAENLESGGVAINKIFRSDVRLPFGGVKNSGYGVELSPYALHEFTVKKSIIGSY